MYAIRSYYALSEYPQLFSDMYVNMVKADVKNREAMRSAVAGAAGQVDAVFVSESA